MTNFQDSLGRNWSIEITTVSIKKLRSELDVDVLSLADEPAPGQLSLLQQLALDPVLLVDVISVLLSDKIRERSLNETEFARGLVGEGLLRALDALVEAIVNFSQPQKGQLIKTIYEKVKLIESGAYSKALMLTSSPEMTKKLDDMLETEFQKSIDRLNQASQPNPTQPPTPSPTSTP